MTLWALALISFVTSTLGCVSEALAQSPPLHGAYVLDAQASDDVAKAIDTVVARMPAWKRPFARSRLSRTAEPAQQLTIAYSGSEVTITMDSRPPTRSPIDGGFADWMTPAGEKMKVSTTSDGGRLRRVFEAKDGRRVDTFSSNAGAVTLTLDSEISSPELPQPLGYKLVYRRLP